LGICRQGARRPIETSLITRQSTSKSVNPLFSRLREKTAFLRVPFFQVDHSLLRRDLPRPLAQLGRHSSLSRTGIFSMLVKSQGGPSIQPRRSFALLLRQQSRSLGPTCWDSFPSNTEGIKPSFPPKMGIHFSSLFVFGLLQVGARSGLFPVIFLDYFISPGT